ncbi:kelch-like protein 23 isoform X2 [Periophthalmus magnuspinnatus]|uniref:kelch-like protein 23 isoform X2 n=1 Tax=Periophthalmus magnuspinnatus TaxID=409849 RepID=UPI00145A223A|nr:kelch-like protein 23 isoform X2 [Periophthalmus magnuspinnatus]
MSHKLTDVYDYEYIDSAHPNELLETLRHFYLTGAFTDVTLQCAESGQVFHCHKAVLSARSSYFKVMFTADMKERSETVINLSGVRCGVLADLVNYVYTAHVRITEDNVQSLLEAADLFQFISVKQACEEFLVRLLDVDNCLGMHAFAQLHLCHGLEKEAQRMTLSRFSEIIQQEEMLDLDLETMKTFLLGHNLGVQSEEMLLDTITKWISHDINRRIRYVGDLLRTINLDLDENNAPFETHGQRLLINAENVKSLITQAAKSSIKCLLTKRKVSSQNMYIIGGYYWHPLCEVHIWDPKSNTWVQGKQMPDPDRESYSVSLLGANIYVTGGYRTNTVEALDEVFIYNCDEEEWSQSCSMITARYYHCSVALHGCIYAIGGYRGGAPEKDCEFYDPLKKQWFPVAQMIQGVGNATACVMGDKIYVTGGHYGYRGSCTYEKVQVFQPTVNEWSVITISPHPEYGLCSVSLNSNMYLVGGQTTMVDCYSPDSNEWKAISEMKERRMECGAVAINGCIYVSGGYSYSKGTYLESIEKYDPELDSWEIVGTLPSPTRSHGCVCVYSL